ncbi:MAG: sugar transferase [Alphaproteobacteria bacterium]|nr:sugar transferase [Alphaproteobacteria bacterium]
MAKRIFDFLSAGLALAILWPLFVVAAAAIKLSSSGPVFFRQERIGRSGHAFRIFKFRTMREAIAGGPMITVADDPRVTHVGRWLRRFKLDELPQLINVMLGDMSLVGPRPEVAHYVALWPASERELILSVRPGITDPASIKFRNEGEILARYADPEAAYREVILPEKVALYADYVRTASFADDISLIFKTLGLIGR